MEFLSNSVGTGWECGDGTNPRTPDYDPAARYFATSIHIGEPQANSPSACVTRT